MTKEELKEKKLFPILLGCDKNRVDLEHMLARVNEYGIKVVNDIDCANIILVQTCAFILPARKEAIENILFAISKKQVDPEIKVIVSGCFVQKNLMELKTEFPEVDAFVSIGNYPIIVNIIEQLYNIPPSKVKLDYCTDRLVTTHNHFAYLKIADGCNNCCAYCTIPRIRGRYKSIEMDLLLKEANRLADNGVKELILVAQDVTKYGEDLYGENRLCQLLIKLSKIKSVEWIRLLYCYPDGITKELLELINNNSKICKYLDIPLQHIDNQILKSMNRKMNETDTRNLISMIQKDYPEIKIRSTFIVGLPGETRKKFIKLKQFLYEAKLDYVGFFTYSREENTKAFYMKHQIMNLIKNHRKKILERQQLKIYVQNATKYIGQEFDVIIDEYDYSSGIYIGRLQCFCPEVDFNVEIDDNQIELSNIYKIKITDFDGYIFKGERV